MSILKIKSGKNKGCYRVRIQPLDENTGKKISVPSKVVSSYAQAKRAEKQLWSDFLENKVSATPEGAKKFADMFSEFVEQRHDDGNWQHATYVDWKYTVKLVKAYFGDTKLKNITEERIRDFARWYIKNYQGKVSRNSTVDRRLQHLRQYFAVLIDKGILKTNKVPRNALHKFFRTDEFQVIEEKYIFTPSEVKDMKSEMIQELKDLNPTFWGSRIGLLIALDVGMRPQEIQALRWNNLIKEGKYHVFEISDSWSEKLHKLNGHLKSRPSNYSHKTLNLSDEVFDVLKKYHSFQNEFLKEKGISNKNNFILLNLRDQNRTILGMPIGQANMNNIIKQVARKVNIKGDPDKINVYTCRHSKISIVANISEDISLPILANRFGNSVKIIMSRYLHADRSRDLAMLDIINKDMSNTQQAQ